MTKRKVLIITGSRGEYGYFRPLVRLMESNDRLEYKLVVTNMHLLPEHGMSVRQIEEDNFKIGSEIFMALAGASNVSMVKSLGVLLLSLSDLLSNERPDFILLFGDRGEQLVGSIVGAYMNIPVGHVQAGELSGNVDGMTRHAITKFAHLHFAANTDAAERLRRMGEEEFRVKIVGAPQLDEFLQCRYEARTAVFERYDFEDGQPLILVVQHPVTEQSMDAGRQMAATLKAIDNLKHQTIVIFPNNDAGSSLIQEQILSFRRPYVRVERNVRREVYAGIMNAASAIVGNSSSGIIEAPSFELPAVNIGRRQAGRLQGNNVINAEHDPAVIEEAIRTALSSPFRESLRGKQNPYGDGRSSERILSILSDIEIDEQLLIKRITY